MARASFASMHLARFEALRASEDPACEDWPGVLFCQVAADSRAAGVDPASREAFVFLVLGLHADAASAERLMNDRQSAAPWLDEAAEVWSAVLQPFRHKGKANYLTTAQPDKFFETLAAPPPAESPAVVLTSIGFDTDGLDMTRVADVALGTGAVRASMTAVPGLYCQHSFFFPGVLARDVITSRSGTTSPPFMPSHINMARIAARWIATARQTTPTAHRSRG